MDDVASVVWLWNINLLNCPMEFGMTGGRGGGRGELKVLEGTYTIKEYCYSHTNASGFVIRKLL